MVQDVAHVLLLDEFDLAVTDEMRFSVDEEPAHGAREEEREKQPAPVHDGTPRRAYAPRARDVARREAAEDVDERVVL